MDVRQPGYTLARLRQRLRWPGLKFRSQRRPVGHQGAGGDTSGNTPHRLQSAVDV